MGGFKTISIIVAANIKGLEKGLGKANKSISSFASKATRLGTLLSFGVTAPIAALGKQAFDTFSNFENEMTKVLAVTGATTDEFKMLTAEAKRLGATTQFTAQQFASLQLILGRKGFDPTAIKNMEGVIADLALATGEDLSLAAETVAQSINAFGLESSNAASVANTLALAAANSSIQLSTFSTAFGHAGSSAKAVGVDIEELSAMMGVLMDNGIKASKAGTGLRKAFIRLNEQGIPFGHTLDRLSEGSMSLNVAQGLVGDTAANQLMILAKNRNKISELTTEYKTNTSGLKDMADLMSGNTFDSVKKLNSAIEGLKIEFGKVIADALEPVIRFLTELAGSFTTLEPRTKKITVAVLSFAAAIGPVALILGTLSLLMPILASGITMVGGAIGVVSGYLLPVLGVIAAISALAIIFQNFIDNSSMGSKFFSHFFDDLEIMFLKFGKWLLEHNPMDLLVGGINKALIYFGKDPLIDQSTEKIKEYADNIAELEKLQASRTPAKYVGLIESAGNAFENAKTLAIGAKNAFKGMFSFGGGTSSGANKGVPETRTLQEAYDVIFGEGAYAAYLEDMRLKQEAIDRAIKFNNALNELAVNTADSFAQSFADVIVSGQGLLKGLGDIFKQLAKQILAMIIKAAILSVLLSATGLGSTEAATKMFGKDQSFKGLLGGMFADGGRPPVGKMSLVGERGPELFVPGSSGTIIPNHALGGGTVIPDVRISGDDLLIVFDRANRRKVRR